jgi:hypothetical protein
VEGVNLGNPPDTEIDIGIGAETRLSPLGAGYLILVVREL